MIKQTITNLEYAVNETVKREVREGGFSGTYVVKEHDKNPRFNGCIDLEALSDINLGYNPSYEDDAPGNTVVVIRDLTRHEINHRGRVGYNGCPRTLNLHVRNIIEPISSVLAKKGYKQADFHYSANALEDTILHEDLSNGCSLDGIIDAYEDDGKYVKSKGETFTSFMEAHLRLNLALWGNKKQKSRLRPYFTHEPKEREKIVSALKNFLQRTGLAEMKKKGNREFMRNYLNNEGNWPEIAKVYAEEFSKLMTPGYAMPLFNHTGKGTLGNPEEVVLQDGNEFDKEMRNPIFRKGRVNEAYEKDENFPAWLDSFEALDLLYKSLAQKLQINVESLTRQSQTPTFYYGSRSFDPDRDTLRHTKFGFDDKGKVELKKKHFYEVEPLEEKIHPRGFPEFRFLLFDTSGSMRSDPENGDNIGKTSNIPWGDNSKYHYALLSWYGLLEYLRENNLLKQATISLGNFGSTTEVAHGLDESKRLALTPRFSDSTKIDLNAVNNIFKDESMLLSTISDGHIDNWSKIREKFIEGAKRHHYFHMQIGDATNMSRDLEKAGLTVAYVKNSRDLAQRVIDITDTIYRGK